MVRNSIVFIVVLMFAMGGVGRVDEFVARAQRRVESRPRQAQPPAPSAEATVVIPEQFVNSFLDAIYINLRAPSYQISGADFGPLKQPEPHPAESFLFLPAAAQERCASVIVLEREMMGVRTAVRFENGRIVAPLAFSGSYNTGLLGCLKLQGWADTVMRLEFDQSRQVLVARATVTDIHLNNVPSLANNTLVGLVQSAIDSRLNPIEILKTSQLSGRVSVSAAGGALQLRAREVRPEIVPGSLRLHIIYEFVRAE